MRSDEAKVVRTQFGALHGGDAIAWLQRLPAGVCDLVFADPPYNAGREDWDAFESGDAYLAWSDQWIAQAARILKPTGSLYVCGFSEVLAEIKVLARRRFASCRWLVWHYRNKANLGRDWGRSHESILHLRREGFSLNLDEARVPYNAHTLRYPTHPQGVTSRYGGARYVWQPHPMGAKPRDVFEVPTLTNGMQEKVAHPTQKPMELVRRLVAAATRPGDLVVDPFGGSGTTFVACEKLGRRWLGCEQNGAYRAIARKRLRGQPHGATAADSERAEGRRRSQRTKLR